MLTTKTTSQRSGYPPQYWINVQATKRSSVRQMVFFGVVTLILATGGLANWSWLPYRQANLLSNMFLTGASIAGALFMLRLLTVLPSLRDSQVLALLPYFKKGDVIVEGDTFLHGHALARNWLFIEAICRDAGLDSLGRFGFADDMRGETVVWHDPLEGLAVFTALLDLLHQNPALLEDSAAVIADLERIVFRLQNAVALRVPFCLLWRYGNTASGYEMDMRQGYLIG